MTYHGQGVGKGVVKHKHAIVHTYKTAPREKRNERPNASEKPMRTPIRIRTDETGDVLDEMSRIDYSRVYTIEKNVKARAFGWVHEDSRKNLDYDFLNALMSEEAYQAWEAEMIERALANSRGATRARTDQPKDSKQEGEGDESESEGEAEGDDDDDDDDNGEESQGEDDTSAPPSPPPPRSSSKGKGKAPISNTKPVERQRGHGSSRN